MGGRVRALGASIGAVLFIGFTWLLFVGVVASQETRMNIQSTARAEVFKSIRTERFAAYKNLEINYVSKRRVPSGPDPIHNRGVGKSRQSPAGRV